LLRRDTNRYDLDAVETQEGIRQKLKLKKEITSSTQTPSLGNVCWESDLWKKEWSQPNNDRWDSSHQQIMLISRSESSDELMEIVEKMVCTTYPALSTRRWLKISRYRGNKYALTKFTLTKGKQWLNQFFWKVHLLEHAYADYQPVMAPQNHSKTLLLYHRIWQLIEENSRQENLETYVQPKSLFQILFVSADSKVYSV